LFIAGLLALVVGLAVPALSLAGGSAGDQQYTDPFGGASGSHSASATTTTPATTTASATPTSTASPEPSTGSADPTTAAGSSSGELATTAGEPTATIATSTPTLPYTGYDAWTAVGFGITLVAGGLILRRRVRAHRA
jgi:LPXTG-motif cell wall-anchored protein